MPTQPWEIKQIDDTALVSFSDKRSFVEDQTINKIGDDLFRLVDEKGQRNIILDFSDVEFFSSAALGKLITLNQKVQAVRGKLVLVGFSKEMLELFTTNKANKLFSIVNSMDEANALFGQTELLPASLQTAASGLTDAAPSDAYADEPPLTGVLTSDDVRQIDEHGVSLGDAIRAIEKSWE
jgi:anti-sigma B factor antagonist